MRGWRSEKVSTIREEFDEINDSMKGSSSRMKNKVGAQKGAFIKMKQENMYGKSARKIIMILASTHSGLTTPSLITVYTISTITATLQVLLSPALIFIRSCTAAFSMTT